MLVQCQQFVCGKRAAHCGRMRGRLWCCPADDGRQPSASGVWLLVALHAADRMFERSEVRSVSGRQVEFGNGYVMLFYCIYVVFSQYFISILFIESGCEDLRTFKYNCPSHRMQQIYRDLNSALLRFQK